jgi:ankyrin repeat protein
MKTTIERNEKEGMENMKHTSNCILAGVVLCGLYSLMMQPVVLAGGRVEHHEIRSDVMATAGYIAERGLSVYVPENYDTTDRAYPVLYLLHGAWGINRCDDERFFGGHHSTNNTRYNIHLSADRLFENKEARPMIIVCPDMNFRPPRTSLRPTSRIAGDYITQEVVPFIDKQYRTIPTRQARAISGHSDGGLGSVFIGFSRPDVFSVVCAIDGWPRQVQVQEHDQKLFPLAFWILGMKAGHGLASATGLVRLLEESDIPVIAFEHDGDHYQIMKGLEEIIVFFSGTMGDSLHHAALLGHVDQVQLLISSGSDVNAKDELDQTPLHWAAITGQRNVAELLLTKGANVNAKNNDGQTPVDAAMARNLRNIVELLVARGGDISNIHLATYLGDAAKVTSFLDEGADVNAKTQAGMTPVHFAVRNGHRDIAELLIENGADCHLADKNGLTPLHTSAGQGHIDIVTLLIDKGADVDANAKTWAGTPLHRAADEGHIDIAKLLIANGADVNGKVEETWTPLHYAFAGGHKDTAEFLISKGADMNTKDDDGQTLLHFAAGWGRKDVVELLLAKGADVNAKNNEGRTPLGFAMKQGHSEIVNLLRKHGAKE